ncbi:MAG: replicative DNA helicase [Bacilli bacterium]
MAVNKEPQNLEAEVSILGCAFLSQSALDKVCEEMSEEMFYDKAHKIIYACLKELNTKNIAVDATTLCNELDKKKQLVKVGGVQYITEILNAVASTANLNHYIKIVFEKFILRNLIDKSTDIITDCYEEKDEIYEIVENAERNILAVNTDKIGNNIKSIQEILPVVQAEIEALSKNKGGITGVSTGFYDLDKLTHGFHPRQLIILAGRPGAGKSALALNIADNAAILSKKTIAFFSLEMGCEEIAKRMYSQVGQIDGSLLVTGKLNNNDWKKWNEAQSQLADAKMFLDDSPGVTVGDIRRKCRRLKNSEKGLDLIVIDYLQLLSSTTKYAGNRVQEVSEVSRDLKKLAMELDVPVLALAQLSRDNVKRKGSDQKPKLSDLRESGSIEQDADSVILLYDENAGDNYNASNIEVTIILAKHRNGPTGEFKVIFEKNMSSFKNFIKSEEITNE